MRILHLVHQYPPDFIGGTEHYTHSIAQHFADAGHAVGVVTRVSRAGQGVEQSQQAGVEVYRLWQGAPTPQQRYLAAFNISTLAKRVEETIVAFRPDVVHVQHLMGLPIASLIRLQQMRIPYLITLHDYWWICANAQLLTNYSHEVCDGPQGYLNCTRCAVARAGGGAWPIAPALWASLQVRGNLLNKALRGANTLLASTPFVAQWYQRHGAPADRLRILPLGIDFPQNYVKRNVARQRLQVGYFGGLAWQKGVHVVVEACQTLGEEVELWVAGSASEDADYAMQLQSHAGPHLHFLGPLGRDEIWNLMAQMDVVVVPSLWYETYSYLLHEALAAGVPVVASRLGVMAEVIGDEVNGLLVAPGDVGAWRAALQRLARDRALLARLSANAPKGEPPLTVAEHVGKLAEIYADICNGSL